jgi:hypothetical protein
MSQLTVTHPRAKVFATLKLAFEAVRTCSESVTDEDIEA